MTESTAHAPVSLRRAQRTIPAPLPGREVLQETLALSGRLFLQLQRRPTTLVAGVLQPLIWLVLFGALFQRGAGGSVAGRAELRPLSRRRDHRVHRLQRRPQRRPAGDV